jgi:glycosyltransferase involved in cell wall biosynthesis
MKKGPLITTIIPTYRRPFLLKRAIKSVLNQTFKNLQVCVYDNASGDETKKIVEEIASKDKRVKYFCHEKNIGSANNFQFGLDAVDTPFFSFLSDDDFLLNKFYENGLAELNKYPEAGFFAGKLAVVNSEGKVLDISTSSPLREGVYSPKEARCTFIGKNNLTWTSVLFNTEQAKKIGPLDLKMFAKLQCVSDVEYIFRMLCYFPMVFSNKICAAFQTGSETFSGKISTEEIFEKFSIFFENLEKKSLISIEEKKEILNQYRKHYFEHHYDPNQTACYHQIKLLIKNRSFIEAREKINAYLLNYKDLDAVKKLQLLIIIRKIPFLWFFLKVLKKVLMPFISNLKTFFLSKKDPKKKLQKQINKLETILK